MTNEASDALRVDINTPPCRLARRHSMLELRCPSPLSTAIPTDTYACGTGKGLSDSLFEYGRTNPCFDLPQPDVLLPTTEPPDGNTQCYQFEVTGTQAGFTDAAIWQDYLQRSRRSMSPSPEPKPGASKCHVLGGFKLKRRLFRPLMRRAQRS
jgi:hypothetical protein